MPEATKWDGGLIKDEGTLGVRVRPRAADAGCVQADRDKEVVRVRYPLGTCNGVQDAAAVPAGAVPMSQPFPSHGAATGFSAKASAGAGPHLPGHAPLPHESPRWTVCAAPVPRPGDVPIRGSRHYLYLPFLFQTARVEVGRLVKED